MFLIVIASGFFSCKSQEHDNIKGNWIDKESESTRIAILDKEGELLLQRFDQKFEVQKINDSVYVMKSTAKDYIINLNNNGELTIDGRAPFIRPNGTHTFKIRGSWVNNAISKSTIYEFKQTPSSLYNTCYVWKDEGPNSNYSPKKTDKGFEFTMGYELVTFNFDKNDKLYDSEGNMYTKIMSK